MIQIDDLSPDSYSGKKIKYDNLSQEVITLLEDGNFIDHIEELGEISFFEIKANKGRFIVPFMRYDMCEANLSMHFSGLKKIEKYTFGGGLGYSIYEIEPGKQYGLIVIGNYDEGFCLYKILPNLGEKVKTMLEL